MKKEFHNYSDVVKQGLILPQKGKYTVSDYKKLREEYPVNQALFILQCSAIFWDAEWSKIFDKSSDDLAIMEMCGEL